MRVLITTLAQTTHFHAVPPLAWALRCAGHEVLVACPEEFVQHVTDAGLTAVALRPSYVDPLETMEIREAGRRGLPAPYDQIERDPDQRSFGLAEREAFQLIVDNAFRDPNTGLIDDLITTAEVFGPDLVLWEPFTFAGPLAAQAVGAAHGRLSFCLDVLGATHDWIFEITGADNHLADWLTLECWQRGIAFEDHLVHGQFTIDQLPAAFLPETPRRVLCHQPVPFGGRWEVPRWLRGPAERPRVAISLGLSAVEFYAGYTVPVGDLLRGCATLGVEVVATIDRERCPDLGTLPDSVRIVDYLPLDALMEFSDVVVHHGGAGTLKSIQRFGRPHVMLPYDFETPAMGRLIAEHGSGRVLPPEDADVDRIVGAVGELLSPGAPERIRAHDLQVELAAMPTPVELVAVLEELVEEFGRNGSKDIGPKTMEVR